jgi:prophage tail gpP-like protein
MATAHGRDHLAAIVDSDVAPSLALEDVTYADVIRRVLVAPRPGMSDGYFAAKDVIIDNDANRVLLTGKAAAGTKLSDNAPRALETLKIDQARPRAGESIYQYLARHAIRFGILVWGTADGKIVFSRPNYAQKPLYSVRARRGAAGADNNAESIARHRTTRGRPSEVRVFGHAHGSNWFASGVHASAFDDELVSAGVYALLTVHDNNARSDAEALQRAKLELSRRKQNADVIHVELAGHAAEDGSIYAIDTMADVAWDDGGIAEARYVARRTFHKSGGKSTTQLELLPKNAIALGDAG